MRATIIRLACALATVLASGAAFAAGTYPDHPVKIIAPFAAGGPSDIIGRILADKLTASLKQQVLCRGSRRRRRQYRHDAGRARRA